MSFTEREWVEVTTLGDLIVRAAARHPDGDAVVFPGRRHSFGSLLEAAERAARSLLGLGVRPGDHVGILMPNCMDFIEVMFGSALIGAPVIPINARFKGRELSYVARDADLRLLVTSDIIDQHTDYVEILHGCIPGLSEAPDVYALDLETVPELRGVVLLGSSSPAGMIDRAGFEAAAESVGPDTVHLLRSRVALRDIAMMMYTSGTTAEPKGCPMTHEQLVRTSSVGCERFEMTSADVFWDPLPLFHMSSILPLIGCIEAGAAYVTLTHFDPAVAIAQLRDEKATICFSTFPTVTTVMLNHPDWDPAALSSIRLMNNVASPAALEEIHSLLPDMAHMNAYGLTECGGVVAFTAPDDPPEVRSTTSGRPFRGIDVQIRDFETGDVVPTWERGEIWCRGFNVFEGYYKDAVKTAECFDDEGWFNTGDIGRMDAEGRVGYLGRVKDMLKVGGENVAAVEIESYLQTHDAVAIAQVVGIPDERYVEVPAAFVELMPGAEVAESDLIAYCKGSVASFKVPRHVRFVKEWPLSATKIQKFRLQEQLCEELGLT
ncbi:MAG: AMP-binding protein [Acidimicrobiia bacterium]|nr:AMP-binding protein [Acidimicrobiia bacterium]MYC46669.1 AMP-binding protein [Acidimicrobiia bacterium]